MPKSKHAPALFELIGNKGDKKAADKLALPKWLKTTPQPEQPTPSQALGPSIQPESQAAPPPSLRQETPDNAGRMTPIKAFALTFGSGNPVDSAPPPASDEPEPIARVRSGRIQLSLNPTNAVLICGGLIIALFCFYLVGRGFATRNADPVQVAGGGTAADDLQAALGRPANGQVLEPPRNGTPLMALPPAVRPESGQPSDKPTAPKAAAPASVIPDSSAPSGGPNRIVIESFKVEHQKSAEHVRQWLLDNYGLKTELKPAGDRIWLVTAEGLDLEKPGQKEYRDKLIADLKSLGESCARELAGKNLIPYRLTAPYTRRFDK